MSPISHICLPRRAASFFGVGQRSYEFGECSSNNSQEEGYARHDRINELLRKKDVRLVSNFTDIDYNGALNCNCLVWLNNENLEAARIWNANKDLGFLPLGNKEEVLDILRSMKERDNRKEGLSKGGKNALDDETG